MNYLTQINDTDPAKWEEHQANSPSDAAHKALVAWTKRDNNSVFALFPCTVWVSLGTMRHENGTPMAVEKFRCERTDHDQTRASATAPR